jgi:LPXTG-motif cell wall-anchored protein
MNITKIIGWVLAVAGIGMLIFAVIATIDESKHGGIQEGERNTVILFIGLAVVALVGGLLLVKKGNTNK